MKGVKMTDDDKNLIKTRERDIYLAKTMGWRYVPPGPETAEMY